MANIQRKTLTTEADFILIVYPWKDPYLATENVNGKTTLAEGKPYILDKGPHYVSFSRSKSIGGTLQIDMFGTEQDVNVGDWVVMKTSAKKRIDRERYTEEGVVRFIGQVYSKNCNHFADADGNLRVTTQVSVREWSHVFHIQVKLDQAHYATAAKLNTAIQSITGITVDDDSARKSEKLLDFLNARFSPFNMALQMLDLVGALSKDEAKIDGSAALQVSTRLPSIPQKLIEDTIELYPGKDGTGQQLDLLNPWSTGFMWPTVGVQKWKSGYKEYSDTFKDTDTLDENLTLLTDSRPTTLTNPLILGNGWSFISALQAVFADSGLYEYYTDLVHFGDSKKVAPTLFARDIPVTFSNLWQDTSLEGGFGWTVLDDIPRTTVDAAAVVSINFNTTAEKSPNYIRFNFNPGVYKGTEMKVAATFNGMYTSLEAQRKFGSVVDERVINAFINEKIVSSSDTSVAQTAKNQTNQWFRACANKAGHFYPYQFMFPTANIQLKQIDSAITVGMAIRIPLPNLTMVGFVESIQMTFQVQGDGKKTSTTYLTLSSVCMEDENKKLFPMPTRSVSSLVRYVPTEDDVEQIKQSWVYKPMFIKTT